jgi:hypothetical protein
MTPSTIPPQIPDDAREITHIIIESLRNRGYDAGQAVLGETWQDFDIKPFRNRIVIGSKIHNRSYLTATWNKRILSLSIFGHRFSDDVVMFKDEFSFVDLADPLALNKLVDFIVKVVQEDKYHYPWL